MTDCDPLWDDDWDLDEAEQAFLDLHAPRRPTTPPTETVPIHGEYL